MIEKVLSSLPDSPETNDALRFSPTWLRRRSISDKLLLGFGLLLTLVGFSGALSLFGIIHVKRHFRDAIEGGLAIEKLSNDAHIGLLQARNKEKNFLLHWKKLGIDAATNRYVLANRQAMDQVHAKISGIQALVVAMLDRNGWMEDTIDEAAMQLKLTDLQRQAIQYEKAFEQLVAVIEKRGHKETGLVGQFRKSVHNVEGWISESPLRKTLLEPLLELRRWEKDYLLRGEDKYVELVRSTGVKLSDELQKLNLPKDSILHILDLIQTYLQDFANVVKIDAEIHQKKVEFATIAATLVAGTEDFATIGRDAATQDRARAGLVYRRTRWTVIGTIILILVSGFVLSFLLARSITIPIDLLTSTTEKVGSGTLSARAPIVSLDEVGNLAHRFNEMTSRLETSVNEIETARAISDRLLLNILPGPIADRLKNGQELIADGFEEASVLFADIVGFTRLSATLSANEVVHQLNTIFSAFDELTEIHGVEKIKTIGDAYMVVAGIPTKREDHAHAIAEMALGMRKALATIEEQSGFGINIRVGINTGPVVAGVIGKKKFVYDLWGDTVNVASRMESHGVPGEIHVTAATFECLQSEYQLEKRGEVEIKGRGKMTTYFLHGKIQSIV